MASNQNSKRATDERKEILTFLLNFTNTILYKRHHVKNQRESDWPLLKLPLIVLEQYFIIKELLITSLTRFIYFQFLAKICSNSYWAKEPKYHYQSSSSKSKKHICKTILETFKYQWQTMFLFPYLGKSVKILLL